jgi:Holliday junction resolvasome RuvABC endonuclease subunit
LYNLRNIAIETKEVARDGSVLLKQKKRSVLDITTFFFRMNTRVKTKVGSTKGLHLNTKVENKYLLPEYECEKNKNVTPVRMRKKKPVKSISGNFFCFKAI